MCGGRVVETKLLDYAGTYVHHYQTDHWPADHVYELGPGDPSGRLDHRQHYYQDQKWQPEQVLQACEQINIIRMIEYSDGLAWNIQSSI